MSVFLISAEPVSVQSIAPALALLGAKSIHSCAWVLPWQGSADLLREHLRPLVQPGSHCVISEATGEFSSF